MREGVLLAGANQPRAAQKTRLRTQFSEVHREFYGNF